jgi:hypothetical protein
MVVRPVGAFDVRPSAWWYWSALGLTVVAVLVGVVAATAAPALVVLALVPIALVVRVVRLRCWTEGDTLRVRNLLRSYAIDRRQVVRMGIIDHADMKVRSARERLVSVQLLDGRTVRLLATGRDYFRLMSLPSGSPARTGADDFEEQLEAWWRGAHGS